MGRSKLNNNAWGQAVGFMSNNENLSFLVKLQQSQHAYSDTFIRQQRSYIASWPTTAAEQSTPLSP
ncbi:13258_t:CDS:2 [Funneliformis geosporum]|uniref:587_t:CDS:1 n=1 Tax=Funneliformis geosporum TaxID=1117311 RepID=A0A9W4X2D2_9GLOM|nr:587_t:CDS:2 [Funneliformis geosporum]CAI2181497.1 13258_t:CDS:2 [Funneliformis geosporum]